MKKLGWKTTAHRMHYTSGPLDVVELDGGERCEPVWVRPRFSMKIPRQGDNTENFWTKIVEAFGLHVDRDLYKHNKNQVRMPRAFLKNSWLCEARKEPNRSRYDLHWQRKRRQSLPRHSPDSCPEDSREPQRLNPQSGRHNRLGGVNEIEIDCLIQEGRSLASFGRSYVTDTSIDVGPDTLKSGDSVWLLEGESIATILREKKRTLTCKTTEETTGEPDQPDHSNSPFWQHPRVILATVSLAWGVSIAVFTELHFHYHKLHGKSVWLTPIIISSVSFLCFLHAWGLLALKRDKKRSLG